MVDNRGREVNGDHLMYMLAAAGRLDGVVATVMSNFGFEQALRERGISLERVDVGDRYVLEGLKRTGFHIGGEQSGHIIFPELLATGDGLLAAVQAARVLSTSKQDLAQWRDKVIFLPQALVNIKLVDKALLDRPDVRDFIAEQSRPLAGTGRLLIRPSGTEPLARVMVEAPDAPETARQIAAKLEKLLSQAAEGDSK
jgi:phosphoglucosamine mutase